MPKKTRRAQRRTLPTVAAVPGPTTENTQGIVARPLTTPRTGAVKGDLSQEYGYVFADLRKIGLIAVAMFVLLFVLAFVLR